MSKAGEWQGRFSGWIQKLGRWKYPVLVLMVGIILLLLPQKDSAPKKENTNTTPVATSELQLQEQKMEALLSRIEGAGKVQVFLSLEAGEQVIYQTDVREQTSTGNGEDSSSREESVVLYSSGSGSQDSLVRVTAAPSYRGAIILCQGADNPTVRLSLMQAVSAVTGLGTDRITLAKMH